jgi:hypothetical protein
MISRRSNAGNCLVEKDSCVAVLSPFKPVPHRPTISALAENQAKTVSAS